MDGKLDIKRYSFLCLLAAIMLSGAGCKGSAQDPESLRPVITVGERVVTVKQYNDALKRLLPEDTTDTNSPELSALKNDLVSQLIEEELLLNEAEKAALDATPAEVSAEVEKIKKASGDEAFKEAVKERYGAVDEWEREIKRKIIIRKAVDKFIGAKIDNAGTSGEDAARRYYREHLAEFTSAEQARARMIVVASADDARNIKKKLTPENFADVAATASLSPERDKGGDLGFFAKGDMPKEFEDAVFKLKPGEISPVIKTEYGYHIFLLTERKKAGRQTYAEAKDKISKKLRQDAADTELAAWIEKLKKETKIEVKEGLL